MTLDEAIKEMREHAESKHKQEAYLNKLDEVTKRIYFNITKDELRSWRMIESMICSDSKVSGANEEHIRDLLKGM